MRLTSICMALGRIRRGACLLLAGVALAHAGAVLAQGAESAAARVNGVVISQARLQSSLDAFMRQKNISAGGVFDPDFYKKMRKRVLDVLIAQELLWQQASARGLVASDEEAEAAVAQLRARYQTESQFVTQLREGGFDDAAAYTADMKRRLSVQKLVAADIAPAVSVSDAEIAEFYKENTEHFLLPEEVHARHILVKVAEDADQAARTAARARIDAIHAEATGGADFAELARTRSEGPSAPRGGDLGFFGRGQMVKPFEDAAFALQPGAISAPVQTQFGFHVIRVEARRGGGSETVPLEAVSAQIGEHLKGQKIQEAVAARAEALRAEGDVVVTADL